jgi:chromate reductase, NAD(P)H dehydrogenase (quinone)
MNVLTICGSLRAASLNAALLRTLARVSPADMEVMACAGIGDLPLFNPDLLTQQPLSVIQVQSQIASADALVIASPEYALAVTGVIKNLLDWLVGSDLLQNKPVAVLNAAPSNRMADAALKATLQCMSADVVQAACVDVPLINELTTELNMAKQPEIVTSLQCSLKALKVHVKARRVLRVSEHLFAQ